MNSILHFIFCLLYYIISGNNSSRIGDFNFLSTYLSQKKREKELSNTYVFDCPF
jgi:hypothetical protein